MGAWQTFAGIAGGAAGALVGLLFVAVSIRVEVIAASRALRDRAAQTLVLFGTVLFVALFLAIPDQTYEALGGELLALAVVTSAMLVYLNRRAHGDLDRRAQGAQGRPDSTPRLAVLLHTAASNSITLVLLVVAALLLVFGLHAGLYVLVAPVIVAFAGGVVSAWLLLTRLPTEPESDGSRGPWNPANALGSPTRNSAPLWSALARLKGTPPRPESTREAQSG